MKGLRGGKQQSRRAGQPGDAKILDVRARRCERRV